MQTHVTSNKPDRRLIWLSTATILVAFLLIGFFTPMGGDDWTWHSSFGLARLKSLFAGYNGRYLGNIIEIVITRSVLARTIIYGLTGTTLIILMARLVRSTGSGVIWTRMLGAGLLLSLSTEVYSQTFGWFAGYTNYVIGMIPVLFILQWVRNNDGFVAYSQIQNILRIAGFFLIGVSSALFVEHITLYSVLVGIGATVYVYWSKRGSVRYVGSFATGALVGAVIMFSNSAYRAILGGTYAQSNRNVNADTGIISKAITTYTTDMYRYLFQENGLILLVLAGLLTIVVFRSSRGQSNTLAIVAKYALSVIMIGYGFFAAVVRNLLPSSNFDSGKISIMLALFSIIFVLAVVGSLFFIDNSTLFWTIIFDMASAVILTAPFAIISPFGPRCEFNSIVFIVIATLELANSLNDDGALTHEVGHMFAAFGITVLLFIIGISCANGIANSKRASQVSAQSGNSVITLKRLPFGQYTWDTSPAPTRAKQYAMFKNYMGIEEKVQVRFVPFKNSIQ